MTAFLCRRAEDLTDQRADLLVETVHKICKGAAKKIDGGIAAAHQKAPGKPVKFYHMAKASVEAPNRY